MSQPSIKQLKSETKKYWNAKFRTKKGPFFFGLAGTADRIVPRTQYKVTPHHRFIVESKEREPEIVFIGDSLIQQMQFSNHHRFIVESKEREPEIVFIGDSLIQQMQFSNTWQEIFQPLHSLNFGIGGDQTQHVLWRVENGGLDFVTPKVIVLLVGTNNYLHTHEEVTEGILTVISAIQDRQKQAHLIVMGIPPKGKKPNAWREKIKKINDSMSIKLDNKPNMTFLNADFSMFINAEGLIEADDMYDYLHLTNQGYRKFCEPLAEEVQNLLKTFVKVESTSMQSSTNALDERCNDDS